MENLPFQSWADNSTTKLRPERGLKWFGLQHFLQNKWLDLCHMDMFHLLAFPLQPTTPTSFSSPTF